MISHKRILILPLLFLSLGVQAQYYNTMSSRCRHYINLSVGAGVAENLSFNNYVTNRVGGNGQFAFTYEIQKKLFFFNFGVGVDYMLTSQGISHFVDQYNRVDKEGDEILYRYVYDNYKEHQHILTGTFPIQFGFNLGQYVYLAVGAKVSAPFFTQYTTKTDMYTEGEYIRFIQPISRNVPAYGFYATDTYKYKGIINPLGSINVAPTFEIGGRIPLDAKKKIDCRVGLYAEYAIPVVKKQFSAELMDYSATQTDPLTQNQADLKANIRFNSLMYSHFPSSVLETSGMTFMTKAAEYLTVGVKATFCFDVTIPPKICVLCYDN